MEDVVPIICQLYGFFFSLYLLAGRWSLSRIEGVDDFGGDLFLEPRTWCVFSQLVLVLSADKFGGNRLRRSGHLLGARHCVVLFLAYMCLSYNWSPDWEPAYDKLIDLSLNLAASIGLIWMMSLYLPTVICKSIFQGFIVITLPLGLLGLGSVGQSRLAVLGGGPNVFGRTMAMMAIVSFYFCYRSIAFRKAFWGCMIAIGVLLVIATGSRGSLVSLSAAVMVYFWLDRQNLGRNAVMTVFGAVPCAVGLLCSSTGATLVQRFQSRIIDKLIIEQYDSGRNELYDVAWEVASKNIWCGTGISGFYYEAQWFAYPHNLFLEAFCEGGCVALLLLALPVPILIVQSRYMQTVEAKFAAALALLLFVFAQFSGDLFDSRGVFLMSIVCEYLTIEYCCTHKTVSKSPRFAQRHYRRQLNQSFPATAVRSLQRS